MGEYHCVGDPIDTDNRPTVFELKLCDYLPCVDPKTFGLSDNTPTVDPYAYFITSGDALAKAIKLEKDMWRLAAQLRTIHAQLKTQKSRKKGKRTWVIKPQYKDYIGAIWKCAGRCRAMVNKLYEAKDINCFLETEWREQHLIVIPKNPRKRP